ncbi:hypothetical protein MMC13_008340 [Lambiella insularis]|nr:hypothetical protein [Lambiella insularis]
MATPTRYDCLVIGSGQGGNPVATAFAKKGKTTALVERTHIGGCCINEGCTPTKTPIASGRVAYHMRREADYAIDMPVGENGSIVSAMQKREASSTDSNTLSVQMNEGSVRRITADAIFINTGEGPSKLRLAGVESIFPERRLDSISIQELDEVPKHLLIIGGGYVALEFGQLFRRFDAEVIIVQRSKQLLPREDPDIAASMLEIFREDGITVLLSTTPLIVTSPRPEIRPSEGKDFTISGSHILSAAGRTLNTDKLNLNAAGVETTPSSHIKGNERLETSVPGIWALGDVKGPPAFTHISYDNFRIIQRNVLKPTLPKLTTTDRLIRYVYYTEPQLAHVGLHAHEARTQFPQKKIQTAKMRMAWVARALETDESRGGRGRRDGADHGVLLPWAGRGRAQEVGADGDDGEGALQRSAKRDMGASEFGGKLE